MKDIKLNFFIPFFCNIWLYCLLCCQLQIPYNRARDSFRKLGNKVGQHKGSSLRGDTLLHVNHLCFKTIYLQGSKYSCYLYYGFKLVCQIQEESRGVVHSLPPSMMVPSRVKSPWDKYQRAIKFKQIKNNTKEVRVFCSFPVKEVLSCKYYKGPHRLRVVPLSLNPSCVMRLVRRA